MAIHWQKGCIFTVLLAIFLPSCGNNEVATAPIEPYDYDNATYPFSLPPLPYAYDALEPYIDALTMHIHHDKHHQGYVDNLNAALADFEDLQNKPLKDLIADIVEIPEEIRTAVLNHGGGVYNHAMFWTMMSPEGGGEPKETVAKAIEDAFGGFEEFKAQFTSAAKKVFGSGWAWLCVDEKNKLVIISTVNQNNPLSGGLKPILCLDVWEHAYYLKYQNRRPDYIDAWWDVINWLEVEELYKKAIT